MITRVLIADDEAPARSRLNKMLSELDGFEVIGEAASGNEVLQVCQSKSPDIVLLDIRMPDMDGIEAARHLATFENSPAIIFTTAFDNYAIDAFDMHAVGYLLKPIRRERLERSLNVAERLARPQIDALAAKREQPTARQNICVRRGEDLHLVPISDIRYFQADKKYITVRHGHGEDLIDEPLKSLAVEFGDRFIRVHRNSLVALDWVDGLEKTDDGLYLIQMRDCDDSLPVSRRHVTDVKACIKNRT